MASSLVAIKVLVVVLLAMAMPVIVVWGVVKILQGAFWVLGGIGRGIGSTVGGIAGGISYMVRHVLRFAGGMIVDSLRFVGAVLTAIVILPLALLNFCFGRWGSAVHYGRALEDELTSAAINIYNVSVGHPIRLLGLGILTEGIERRIPELVARAPQVPARRRKPGKFAGYKVKGNLQPGGSGALLYLARPEAQKVDSFRRSGHPDPGDVVIKSFALASGSTLPQIVRESRALEAASRLGLVLEHELTDDAFFYVMPFVPGERLDKVITTLHERNGEEGLSQRDLGVVMSYASDLLQTLDRFHGGGLWHKDIKPGNLIVSNGRVHLVDLGLVTPLQSAMTLTTHGTEYFRDPEMVRLAMKGVKVHEVDGGKFDIYSTGAVLYSMIENSFPAHGSLSRINRRCPEALKWIVRRSMAEMGARYAHAWEMLADLRKLHGARDPFAVKPAELPSVRGLDQSTAGSLEQDSESFFEPVPLRPVEPARPAAKLAGSSKADRALDLPTTRTMRRKTSRTLVAAGLWGMVVGGSVAGYVALANDGPAMRLFPVEPTRPTARRSDASEQGKKTLAQEEERWRKDAFGWSKEIMPLFAGAQPRSAEEADVALAQANTTGRVLILEDLSISAGAEELSELRSVLESEGFDVLGDDEGAIDPRSMELEAGLRKAIGIGGPEDPETAARIEEYLGQVVDLDAIVWITSDPGQADEARYHLVVHPGLAMNADSGREVAPNPGRRP